jgi:hypothetical protein
MKIRTRALTLALTFALATPALAQDFLAPEQIKANQLCADRYKTEEYQAYIAAKTLSPDACAFSSAFARAGW